MGRFLLFLLCLTAGLAQQPAPTVPVLPVTDPIEGRWTGTITAPQGDVAEFGLDFFHTQRGAMIFRMQFPAMFTYNAVFPIPVEGDGQGNYAITEAFAIKLHRDGDRLTGTFGTGLLPLVLKRGGRFSGKPAAPVHPPAPAPLWTHPLGSGTWAPPITAGDVIYLGTSDGKFHAVNCRRWQRPLGLARPCRHRRGRGRKRGQCLVPRHEVQPRRAQPRRWLAAVEPATP